MSKRGLAARQAERWGWARERDEMARMTRVPPGATSLDGLAEYVGGLFDALEANIKPWQAAWVQAFREAEATADQHRAES